MSIHPTLSNVTERIIRRSQKDRAIYLSKIERAAKTRFPQRSALSCANLAHGCAAIQNHEKIKIKELEVPNIGIISSYNEMLSAHAPYNDYPEIIKQAASKAGGTAQFAGGVPAMCDGITQGNAGMEMSLFSRDVIAMATAIALSHNMFDGVLCLGVCDKIVPGMLIGALKFGHLPTIFVPSGPMETCFSNEEKALARQKFELGEIGKKELLEAESRSYHGLGTCTFYGTANSNQLLMEVMGLHLPSSAFIHPCTPLRKVLIKAATERVLMIGRKESDYSPIGNVIDEKAIVNGIVGILATGGSTNHTLHLVAIARAANITINWDDFDNLSRVVPLLARIYPSGKADVNRFHAAGGTAFLIRELLDAGFLHENVLTIAGLGLRRYVQVPALENDVLVWKDIAMNSGDLEVLRPTSKPFSLDGGLRLVKGRLGRGIIKISSISPKYRKIRAPAIVFDSQEEVKVAFDAGKLDRDFIAVVRYQGVCANGMPELHRLTPLLSSLLDRGKRVALLTDGRMSGASGKVPAVIHLSPEAILDGPICKIRNGDLIVLDAEAGTLDIEIDDTSWQKRTFEKPIPPDPLTPRYGNDLFDIFKYIASSAEHGSSVFG